MTYYSGDPKLRKTEDDLKAWIEYCKQQAVDNNLPEWLQLELDFMDDMFMKRMEDPKA